MLQTTVRASVSLGSSQPQLAKHSAGYGQAIYPWVQPRRADPGSDASPTVTIHDQVAPRHITPNVIAGRRDAY